MPIEQPQAIRTIFFDVGFTLLHPYPSLPEICHQVCQQLHLHIHLDDVRERMYDAEDYFLRQQRLNRHTWASQQAINEFWIGYYMNLLRPFVEEHDEPRLYQLAQTINQEFEKHTSWQVYLALFCVICVLLDILIVYSSLLPRDSQSLRQCCMIWRCSAAMPLPTILCISETLTFRMFWERVPLVSLQFC